MLPRVLLAVLRFFILIVVLLLPFQSIDGWMISNHCYHPSTSRINTGSKIHPFAATSRILETHLQSSTMMDESNNNSSTDDDRIQVIHRPDNDFLSAKGVWDWPTWGCPVSKFPWSYSDTEVCYLIKGKVIITPVIQNSNGSPEPSPKPVTIAAGDYVTLAAGLSCTWDVVEAVEKHYMFN